MRVRGEERRKSHSRVLGPGRFGSVVHGPSHLLQMFQRSVAVHDEQYADARKTQYHFQRNAAKSSEIALSYCHFPLQSAHKPKAEGY